MSTSKPVDRRYSDICGATNNRGEECKLPAGWGTPGSQGGRCRFHGGSSTGPSDTSHLDENDFAKNNPGGGAPEGNTNAEIHGGFSDWRKAYDRFDEETKAYVDYLRADVRERSKEHAPEVPEDRRDRLAKEYATLSILWRRASADTAGTPDDPAEGARGIVIEEEREYQGETYVVEKANPAFRASSRINRRKLEIGEELKLYPIYWDD